MNVIWLKLAAVAALWMGQVLAIDAARTSAS